jgi:hypothetical protein
VTDLVPQQPRQLAEPLLEAIAGLETQVRAQAIENLGREALGRMTGAQCQAAIVSEMLKVMSTEVDYAHTRLKAQLLAQLEAGELWAQHPGDYGSLDELAVDLGISKSEASDLLAWERHIYPWLERELALKPFQVWQSLPKTKRRRLTPYLRVLADPDHETDSDKIRASLASFRMAVREEEDLSPAEEDRAIAAKLLNLARGMTTRDMEHALSPEHTPAIVATALRCRHRVIDGEGEIHEETLYQVVFTATWDQLVLLRRRFPDRLDLQIIDGPDITERSTAAR